MNINPIANYSNPYDKYTQKSTANNETNQNINNPVLKDDMLQNDISNIVSLNFKTNQCKNKIEKETATAYTMAIHISSFLVFQLLRLLLFS